MQLTLFDIAQPLPQGFSYFPDFISPEEEASLTDTIELLELHPFIFQGYTAKRKTASFGNDQSIPASFQPLVHKIAAQMNLHPGTFTQLLVTAYPPGSVINWHRDAPSYGIIAGISLHADCTFRLRPYEKEKQHRRTVISFPVERRSLYIMQGPARTDWQHSISPVQNLRYSITLRTVKS